MEWTETLVQPEGEHPTRMLRAAGFSLLATASKESDGMVAVTAPENMLAQVLALTGSDPPHSLSPESPTDMVSSTFVRKS